MFDRDGSPDPERTRALLEELMALSREQDAVMARATTITGELVACGGVERLAGMPLDYLLMLQARQRGSDAKFLLTAGEVLGHMPVLAGLLGAGKVSWSVTREVIWKVSGFGRVVRGQVDQRLAATLAQRDLDDYDPDGLIDAVELAVADARATASAERREERAARSNYVAVQRDFDGGVRGHFAFDPIAGAIVLGALDAAADAINQAGAHDNDDPSGNDGARRSGGDESGGGHGAANPSAEATDPSAGDADLAGGADRFSGAGSGAGGDADGGDRKGAPVDGEQEAAGWERRTARGRQLGGALERLARFWLSGGKPGGQAARPLIVVHVKLDDVTANVAGVVELGVRGALPSLTLRTLEALSTDADMRAVIFDGARPLAVSAKLALSDPSADTRFAVAARDLGSRFPGDRDPAAWCDVDHARARVDGGSHDPDNLALLSRRTHVWKHKHGWRCAIDPSDGTCTITRDGVSYRSLPRGTPLAKPTPTWAPGRASAPDRAPRSDRPPPGQAPPGQAPPGQHPTGRPPPRATNRRRPTADPPDRPSPVDRPDGLPF